MKFIYEYMTQFDDGEVCMLSVYQEEINGESRYYLYVTDPYDIMWVTNELTSDQVLEFVEMRSKKEYKCAITDEQKNNLDNL